MAKKNSIDQEKLLLWGFLPLLFFLVFSQGFGQDGKTITGKVTASSDALPLPGANIVVKGTTNGNISDFDGNYSIKATKGDILVFSYVGFKEQEVTIGNQTIVDVVLQEDSNLLDEVVIIGYGSVKKSDLTGALSSIKNDEIVKSKSVSLLEGIQGRVSGVQIKQQSGEPGAGVDIKIRGTNSINASSSPLYVIDGVQLDFQGSDVASSSVGNATTLNPLATLNPNDIASIEILKDASATAIFGSRGANGVVIITTKSGESGKATFTYNSYVSLSEVSNELDILSGEDYISYRRQEDLDNTDSLFGIDTDGDGIKETPRDLSELTLHNWQDEAFRTAVAKSHYISLTGGNEKTKYSVSAGFLNQEGVVVNNEYERFNFRSKLEHKLSDKFELAFTLNGSLSEQSGATSAGGEGQFNGVLQSLVVTKPVEFFDPDDPEDLEFNEFISPINQLTNSDKFISLSQNIANLSLKYNFNKDLSFKMSGGGNISNSKGREFYGSDTRSGVRDNGRAVLQQRSALSYFTSGQLDYALKLNKNHNINFLGVAEFLHRENERFRADATNFPDESTRADDISKAEGERVISSNRDENNLISYLGRINYNMFGKYLFTTSFRADGSDRFGPDNKWGYFPSAAFAWKANKEKFIEKIGAISNLKFRLSYGVTGNERIPSFAFLARLGNDFVSVNDDLTLGLSPRSRGNDDLKWETTQQYNAGMDLGLFNNRINLTAEVYKKETQDLLLDTPIASQTGFFSVFTNVGQVNNQGVEFSLNTENIVTNNFSWSTSFNIAYNKNEVKSIGSSSSIPVVIPGGFIQNVGIVEVGAPIGAIYGYEFDGVYQIDDFTWQDNSDPNIAFEDRVWAIRDGVINIPSVGLRPGSFKFKDLDGDEIVDPINDQKVIGNSSPTVFGGLNNSFRYKNFDAQFFLEFQSGNEIFNEARFRLEGRQNNNITQSFFNGRWTPDNPTNQFGDVTGRNATSQFASSYYVEDASYIRLANVSVGYNLPTYILEKLGLSSLRLYATATNIYTWTDYSGYDPDISFNNPLLTGFDRTSYPRSRSFILGINLSL